MRQEVRSEREMDGGAGHKQESNSISSCCVKDELLGLCPGKLSRSSTALRFWHFIPSCCGGTKDPTQTETGAEKGGEPVRWEGGSARCPQNTAKTSPARPACLPFVDPPLSGGGDFEQVQCPEL